MKIMQEGGPHANAPSYEIALSKARRKKNKTRRKKKKKAQSEGGRKERKSEYGNKDIQGE